MSKKLYVGNLSYDTTEDTLRDAFSKVGAVEEVFILKDKVSGRPRGFAFVTMVNDDEGEKAVEMWNGQEVDGRKLVVNEARPMADRPQRRFGGGGGGFGGGFGGGGRGGGRGGFGGGRRDY